jgi:hydrogenase maturation protease
LEEGGCPFKDAWNPFELGNVLRLFDFLQNTVRYVFIDQGKALRKIICLGNRFTAWDSAGMVVYDRLKRLSLPPNVDVVDGGLLGLNLLSFMEGADQVVLIDAVHGFGRPGQIIVLQMEEVLSIADELYDRVSHLGHLLKALPRVLGLIPELVLLGIEGEYSEESIGRAVDAAITLTTDFDYVSCMALSREAS